MIPVYTSYWAIPKNILQLCQEYNFGLKNFSNRWTIESPTLCHVKTPKYESRDLHISTKRSKPIKYLLRWLILLQLVRPIRQRFPPPLPPNILIKFCTASMPIAKCPVKNCDKLNPAELKCSKTACVQLWTRRISQSYKCRWPFTSTFVPNTITAPITS